MIKFILLGLLGLIVLFWDFLIVGRVINARKYRIRSNNGIQKTEYLTIGGIQQFIQIRGQNISNPIIIVIHGGPGQPIGYYSYSSQEKLEHDYTVVHWDQRGSGNTYYRNPDAKKPNLDLLLADLDELVDYVCAEYKKEKIIIMGHSWGSVLGGIYVNKHPRKVLAYVGSGQFVDPWQSEQYVTKEAIRLANLANNASDAKKIDEQYRLLHFSEKFDVLEFLTLRQLTSKYLPKKESISFLDILLSPYLTMNNLRWLFMPSFSFNKFAGIQNEIYGLLFSKNGFSMYKYIEFAVPVLIVMGDSDWITPYRKARDYYDNILAPKKEFILVENAGHLSFKKLMDAVADNLKNVINE